jgi:hypothetical protein
MREKQILLLEKSLMPDLWISPQIRAGFQEKVLSFARGGSSPTTSATQSVSAG